MHAMLLCVSYCFIIIVVLCVCMCVYQPVEWYLDLLILNKIKIDAITLRCSES